MDNIYELMVNKKLKTYNKGLPGESDSWNLHSQYRGYRFGPWSEEDSTCGRKQRTWATISEPVFGS